LLACSRAIFFCCLLAVLGACSQRGAEAEPVATVDPQVAQGKRLFSQHCASCHATEPDTIIVGPSLAGIASRAAERSEGLSAQHYIELSILQPSAFIVPGFGDAMPSSFGKRLSGEELDALVAFLLTLE
jgi:nitric oxide reductase subunit C